MEQNSFQIKTPEDNPVSIDALKNLSPENISEGIFDEFKKFKDNLHERSRVKSDDVFKSTEKITLIHNTDINVRAPRTIDIMFEINGKVSDFLSLYKEALYKVLGEKSEEINLEKPCAVLNWKQDFLVYDNSKKEINETTEPKDSAIRNVYENGILSQELKS